MKCVLLTGILFFSSASFADELPGTNEPKSAVQDVSGEIAGKQLYTLGPHDQVTVEVTDLKEIGEKPYVVGVDGTIHLPYAGKIAVTGLTADQLEARITERLGEYMKNPEVRVAITVFESQPISVIGAVNKPGVHQLKGARTLAEVLALAGGLNQEAGFQIMITRRQEYGLLPLDGATQDKTGLFNVAEVSVKELLEARNPRQNILIKPYDVISVPRALMVYVIGEVKKSGGFALGYRQGVSVLQALSMAEGLTRTASASKARILRVTRDSAKRTEIPINLKSIMSGSGLDITLQNDDILFVPNNVAKTAALRAAEAAIQVGSGVAVWRIGTSQ